MVEEKVEPELIVAKILTSPCNFDVFPPVLRDLRRRGVPEEVLRAMKAAPNGPPALAEVDPNVTPPPWIEIPEGTIIQVETLKETSSAKVKEGDLITFLAKRRIYVNNVMVSNVAQSRKRGSSKREVRSHWAGRGCWRGRWNTSSVSTECVFRSR